LESSQTAYHSSTSPAQTVPIFTAHDLGFDGIGRKNGLLFIHPIHKPIEQSIPATQDDIPKQFPSDFILAFSDGLKDQFMQPGGVLPNDTTIKAAFWDFYNFFIQLDSEIFTIRQLKH
jgi:hypothetical protein